MPLPLNDRLALKPLVLLPGLDGTGLLFSDFLASLPRTLTSTVVEYPKDRFLSYGELVPRVTAAAPKSERFVLLAESFSTPLAIKFAATNPPNLAALVLCAGFVLTPLAGWSWIAKLIVRAWLFRIRLPGITLKYFLLGADAPPDLVRRLGATLGLISPETLSGRVQEVLNCDVRTELAQTRVPILYIRALSDKLVSSSCHEEILRVRPEIDLATVEAPHMILQREPVKVAEIVVAFVAKCE